MTYRHIQRKSEKNPQIKYTEPDMLDTHINTKMAVSFKLNGMIMALKFYSLI